MVDPQSPLRLDTHMKKTHIAMAFKNASEAARLNFLWLADELRSNGEVGGHHGADTTARIGELSVQLIDDLGTLLIDWIDACRDEYGDYGYATQILNQLASVRRHPRTEAAALRTLPMLAQKQGGTVTEAEARAAWRRHLDGPNRAKTTLQLLREKRRP